MFEFVVSSDYFFGLMWMVMCKVVMDVVYGIEYSIVVIIMVCNGVEFGLWVSGLLG